ncbi:MAG: sulfatase-like hydrolase/transferase [Phycisphaerae bacterium]|nr:sulfatase-like hydrolase/transferase [Phycisphaerae bacterium]
MNRRDFLKLAGASGASLLLANRNFVIGAGGSKPNIVFLILDELGYYELSCMGHPIMETPNIDRIVAEGMRFTQMLAGAPVCAPTRSTLMTGKHMGHTSVRRNPGQEAIRAEDVTVAQVLKRGGYATGGFGKWGIGGRGTTGVPEKHGFDVFLGYYDQVHAHTFFPAYLVRNSEEVPLKGNTGALYEGETFSHQVIFAESMKFIRQNKDKPFLCYCPWTPPHGAWGLPEDEPSWQKYKDKKWDAGYSVKKDEAQRYAAMVNMIDRQIGQIMGLLKDLKIDDNTIVFVCGDNGGNLYFANKTHPHGFFGPNVDPKTGKVFRGRKGLLYEGGLRIPFIVRWPGRIKAGSVSEHLGYFPDVMPTLAELAGADCPGDIDGISILPALLGARAAGRAQKRHEYLYWEFMGQTAVRWGNWKAYKSQKGQWELYDLSSDIEEQNNVAPQNPDTLAKMVEFARQAHQPHVPGEVLDKELCMKDHSKTKNPKPSEQRRR